MDSQCQKKSLIHFLKLTNYFFLGNNSCHCAWIDTHKLESTEQSIEKCNNSEQANKVFKSAGFAPQTSDRVIKRMLEIDPNIPPYVRENTPAYKLWTTIKGVHKSNDTN